MTKLKNWQPRAELETIRTRGALYAKIRCFFAQRQVLEVDTPMLSTSATVDPNIDSFGTHSGRWLQTSPEFAMKRLLAAGSGAIYQIARVFRLEESGRLHNPEFTLLEWYRPGWDYRQLMEEVQLLLIEAGIGSGQFASITYRDAFKLHAGLDPFTASPQQLRQACADAIGPAPEPSEATADAQRDFWLDLLMSAVVGPRLGAETPQFLYDFPASQAALARVRQDHPPVAERFELFWKGLELANGFGELTDAEEQRRRFESDQQRRGARGQRVPPYDERLIDALAAGLPACAGVAIGLDRLLMLILDLPHIGDTLSFDFERA
ncbi:MAG: genX [Nevskia sp.]|nr:genX [Nevskia sp.]